MSFRSLGAKVLNNAKIFVNTQSTLSHHPLNSEQYDDQKVQKETNLPHQYHSRINKRPIVKKMNSNRRKRRQRMHFKPIIPEHYICPITQV